MKIDEKLQKYYPSFIIERQFKKWLTENTKYTLNFTDNGQDCLTWHLCEGGEILHAEPLKSTVWNGKIVALRMLEVGKNAVLMETELKKYRVTDFIVKSIKIAK
jgi:hypothetical protein